MFGILNINKSPGLTSRAAVNRVQRIVRPAKAGHAGTLDPLATGVLVVCVGRATRLMDYVQRMPKRYLGTFLLGRESDTEDADGNVCEISGAAAPSRRQIDAALPKFIGEIQQRPPAYSALKINGRRAYAMARRGETVDLPPRPVRIDRLEVVEYAYPRLVLDVTCGRGTYIRSLGRDLAREVGTQAVMSALVRTGIGPFRVEDAVALEDLTRDTLAGHLLPANRAVSQLPHLRLNSEEVHRVSHGQFIPRSKAAASENEIAAVDEAGRLVAILCPRNGQLGPARNFANA